MCSKTSHCHLIVVIVTLGLGEEFGEEMEIGEVKLLGSNLMKTVGCLSGHLEKVFGCSWVAGLFFEF